MFNNLVNLNIFNSKNTIRHYIQNQIAFHRLIFTDILDPFTQNEDQFLLQSQTLLVNSSFIQIWFIFFLLTIYSFYGLDPDFTFSRDFLSPHYYMNSPRIYYHQAHAKRSHGITEVILIFSFITINLNYLAFIFLVNFNAPPKPILGKNKIDKKSNKNRDFNTLNKARAKGGRILRFNLRFFFVYYIIFSSKSVQANGHFEFNLRNVFFWFLLHPIGVAYYIWNNMLPISAAVCARLLQLEQSALLSRFKALNERLQIGKKLTNFTKLRKRSPEIPESWRQYLRLNYQLLANCQKIEAYARFWTIQMSIAFAAQVFKMCYEAFALMRFGSSMNVLQKAYFVLYPAYYTVIMLWYVSHCTALDRRNEAISGQCLQYLNQIYRLDSEGSRLPLSFKIKAELFAQRGRLEGYVLKLFTGYRVNSNTLIELIGYVAVLFLKIIEHNR